MRLYLEKNTPTLALASAALFGISPVLIKKNMGELHPIFIAGLLYLGSALGLILFQGVQKNRNRASQLSTLSQRQWFQLIGSVLSGGILAPICLIYGLQNATAFEASVLLNLETVATTLIAWIIFHENTGFRLWVGKFLLLLGGAYLAFSSSSGASFSHSSLLLIGAALFWGIDNNLTREIETLSPSVLAIIKGVIAGGVNCGLAYGFDQLQNRWLLIFETLTIGALSYGLSLIFFIQSLRTLGSSRTSTYFSVNPFFGILFALLLLGEKPQSSEWISAMIMLLGVIILYFEEHDHLHTHAPLAHSHPHIHDEHHQHSHLGNEGLEPHDHFHIHEELTHSHAHDPDIHHRHSH